nr:SigE family RNA polymerase sigma factor [Catenulispora pinisilvae]
MSVAGAVAWPARTIWWPRRHRAAVAGARARQVGLGVAAVVAALREALNTPTEDAEGDLSASGNHPLAMIGGSTAPRGHRALQPGAGPSLADLYYAHRLSLVRLAILLVDDQASAEDVVQDSFTGLWRRYGDDLTGMENPVGYLRTAVVNNARSVLRRRKTARGYTPPHIPDAASAESVALLSEEHREVLEAIQKLPPRQREVLVLRYWSDLSEADIADALGISRGTVKSTASRGLEALGKLLKG